MTTQNLLRFLLLLMLMMRQQFVADLEAEVWSIFCISDTFVAKENKDIRLVQQQTKHLRKCKYVNNDYASCGPQA